MRPKSTKNMSLFTAIKRWEDGVIPMAAPMVRMLGVNFDHVEHVFFTAMKGTTVDSVYAVNHVLLFFIPNENFSIGVRHNGDIFVNCKVDLNRCLLLNKEKRFGSNVVWFWCMSELVRMWPDLDDSEIMYEDNTFAEIMVKHRRAVEAKSSNTRRYN